MTDENLNDNANNQDPNASKPDDEDDGLIRGQVRHQQLSARIPESVSRGVFTTGAIVLMGGSEFIIDFVIRMQRPHQIAQRVVIPHAVLPQVVVALEKNLKGFTDRFGDIPKLPKPPKPEPGAPQPSIEEIYDDLKLPDEELSGVYANAVMISHSPAEFCFDFITNFFPRSAVSARVYVSAPQVPRLLDALKNTHQEFQKRLISNRQAQIKNIKQSLDTPSPLSSTNPPSEDDGSNPYYHSPKDGQPDTDSKSSDTNKQTNDQTSPSPNDLADPLTDQSSLLQDKFSPDASDALDDATTPNEQPDNNTSDDDNSNTNNTRTMNNNNHDKPQADGNNNDDNNPPTGIDPSKDLPDQ